MQRYSANGPLDAPSMTEGDDGFVGVDQYDTAENIPPQLVQDAQNIDFSTSDAVTRGGFVCLPSLSLAPLTLTWTSRTPAAQRDWSAVTYGGGQFVAVGEDGSATDLVQTSIDGITWTSRAAASAKSWKAITYGNGLYVAVARSESTTATVMTSPDGINWTMRAASTANVDWYGVTYGDGLFVAVGYDGASVGYVMTSPDGITWTARTGIPAREWEAVTYGGGLFVAVAVSGTGNRVMTSPDGITWTARTSAADNQWDGIAHGGGQFVAVARDGADRVMTSPDGITWTARTAAAANQWQSVTFGASLFVAVSSTGTGNRAMVSRDGITWAASASSADKIWFSVAFGAGVFAAVSNTISAPAEVMTAGYSTLVYASGTYSDPLDAGSQWIMLAGPNSVGFHANGRQSRVVDYPSGQTVSEQSTIVQANNRVYLFRGPSETPLVWDGNWSNDFTVATGSIPESSQAIYYQNRLWAIDGKDTLSASDVLDFTTWNNLDNSFNLSKGDSNFLVTTYPFGDTTIIVFKNRSILAITGVDGALNDIVATEITRQVGAIGINSVVSVGPDLVYMSDRNINLLTLTATNNAIQHKTLPLSRNIQRIFQRVNWNVANKVSMGYNDNKLYVALPLDNATACNAVVVYNFVTENWYGEWNFADEMNMTIQGWAVVNYLGLQRMHCISEDGRIFVTDEGPNDISGTTVAEITTSLTTRAYRMDDGNRVNRRMWADISTWRPSYSVTAYVDGASENTVLVTNQTYARSQSWIFGDSTYSLTNSGDNYNRQGRKDYAGLPSESIQPQSGFLPEMRQDYRIPLIFRRKGRLVWYKVENAQGVLSLNGIGGEARAGDRNNYPQVI